MFVPTVPNLPACSTVARVASSVSPIPSGAESYKPRTAGVQPAAEGRPSWAPTRPPDPEREKRYAGATYKTYTNREIVSSVCCESPRSMSESVRVCSTQVTSQPSAMEVADDTRGLPSQV